jgi:uncharacterized membrane protein YeaQ/YmgE (transglycosylase-associated protein family)
MSAESRWGGIGVMMLETNSLIVILIVGLIAGWLAGQIMKGSGFGLIGDLIVGIIGAFIGTWLWGVLHLPMIANFWVSAIVIATVGALVLLFILRLIKR